MVRTLRAFQKEGVGKMVHFLRHGPAHATYNASDPGTGKSIMSIFTCTEMRFKKILVISPANMLLTWKREWENTPSHLVYVDAILSYSEKDKIQKNEVVILSYGLVHKFVDEIVKAKFECVILDEAHYVKSPQAIRSKTILRKLWPHIPYRIALSGTPFTTSITDCYTVFSRMVPEKFGTFHDFGSTFCHARRTNWGIKYEGARNAQLLSETIRDTFFVRYKKIDVLKELPPKTFQKIILPKSLSVRAYEDELRSTLQADDDIENEELNLELLRKMPDHFMGLMRLQGELKVDTIVSYAKDLLDQNIPIILFAINKTVIAKYVEALHEYNPVVVTGDVGVTDRQKAIDDFQSTRTNLFIGNIQAAGVGITLTRAEYVLFGQMSFSPADMEQAIARAERIGMVKPLMINYFVVEDSIDERISDVIVERANNFKKVLN